MSNQKDKDESIRGLHQLLEDYKEQGAMAAFLAEPHEGWFLNPIKGIRLGYRWEHGPGKGELVFTKGGWAERFWDRMETIAWHYEMYRLVKGKYIFGKPFHKLGLDIYDYRDPKTGRTLMDNFSGWDAGDNFAAIPYSGCEEFVVEFTLARGQKICKEIRVHDHVICDLPECPARERSAGFCRRLHDCATPNKFQKLIPCDDSVFGGDDALTSINLIQKRVDTFRQARIGISHVDLTFSDDDILDEIRKELVSTRRRWAQEPRRGESVRPGRPRKQRPRSWRTFGLMFLTKYLPAFHMALKKNDLDAINYGKKQFKELNDHYYRAF